MKKIAYRYPIPSNFIASLDWSRKLLGWDDASEEAKQWWQELEEINDDRSELLIRLAGELLSRGSSIEDFFTACLYSGREGVQANLDFLDTIKQDAKPPETRVVESDDSDEGSSFLH